MHTAAPESKSNLSTFSPPLFHICFQNIKVHFRISPPRAGFFGGEIIGVLDSFLYGAIRSTVNSAVDDHNQKRIKRVQEESRARYGEVTESELAAAKAQRIKAEYFLRQSKKSAELAEEAALRKMTVSEYLKYCKKCISNYEDTLRIYNLTHDIPAEY